MKNIKKKELKEFIGKRKHLIWHVDYSKEIPVELIVEHTLNDGTWEDVQELIKIIGIEKMAIIFRKQTIGPRLNYRPEVINYFKLYFNKYARQQLS